MAEIKNLTVRYGKNAVLKDFSAEFPEGSVTAISGRSGCGKTTLLSAVSGLLRPAHGTLSGFGTCSVLFQEDRLLPFLTAVKNLTVTTGCTETEAKNALMQVGFDMEDIEKTASDLNAAYTNLQQVTEPELIDYYIYHTKAVQTRYRYLLNCAKKLEDSYAKNPL